MMADKTDKASHNEADDVDMMYNRDAENSLKEPIPNHSALNVSKNGNLLIIDTFLYKFQTIELSFDSEFSARSRKKTQDACCAYTVQKNQQKNDCGN